MSGASFIVFDEKERWSKAGSHESSGPLCYSVQIYSSPFLKEMYRAFTSFYEYSRVLTYLPKGGEVCVCVIFLRPPHIVIEQPTKGNGMARTTYGESQGSF